MSQRFTRIFTILVLAISTLVLVSLSFDAEARRMGGGRSFGRQSPNVMQQRQAAQPPAATTAPRAAATPAAGARSGAAATNTARTGMSRWLGPIAGIAAGLGIAALLSAMGLSGAFLELLSSLVLIGLLVFGVMFIIRRLRGSAARPATHGASPMQRQSTSTSDWQRPLNPSAPSAAATPAPAFNAEPAEPVDESWFIPENFDTPGFLQNAKAQFVKIQAVWDSGDAEQLREYLTDDLIAEIKPELQARAEGEGTEVVLLNAEMLGIETVSGGHLASIRYSGMLREGADTDAFRFEEVWNLYKAENEGWLLAGIQQLPAGSSS